MRIGILLSLLAAACVRPGDAAAQPTPAPQFAATREALCTLDAAMPGCRGPVPDTIPDEWWYLPRRHREITSRTRGRVCIPDAVHLGFSPGVARAEKQAIIDSTGVLEGGYSYRGSIYIVRIPGDGTTGPLSRALEYARGQPQVQYIAQSCYDQIEEGSLDDLLPAKRLLDSAAIAALSRLPPPPDTARPARAFYIHFDSAGRPDTVRAAFPLLVDSTFAARVRDALQPALRVRLPVQPSDLTVIVNTGPDASLTPWVFTGRQARVANQTHVSNQLHRAMRQLRQRDTLLFGRQFTVLVRMIANVDSTATSASVTRSSGVPAVDSVALNVASEVRFSPGEVEGIPTPMWVWLPINLVFPEETRAERRRRLRRQATSSSPPR